MLIVKDIFLVTQKLTLLLEQTMPQQEDDRDEYINTIEELLSDRQHLIEALPQYSPNEAEKQLAKEVVKLNQVIEAKLQLLQQTIKKDMNLFKEKKVKNRLYDSPYDGPTPEGVFFDKRTL